MSEQAGDHQAHDPSWERRYERNAFIVLFVVFVVLVLLTYYGY